MERRETRGGVGGQSCGDAEVDAGVGLRLVGQHAYAVPVPGADGTPGGGELGVQAVVRQVDEPTVHILLRSDVYEVRVGVDDGFTVVACHSSGFCVS